MSSIPVFGTVSRAYGFLLGEIGTVVRLTWAPLLIGAAFNYVYGGEAMDAVIRAGTDPAAASSYQGVQVWIGLVAFVTGVMALVALLRVVIFGDRKPGLFVYLWLGAGELRLMLVSVLLFIAVVAGAVGIGIAFGLLGALSSAIPVLSVVVLLALLAVLIAAIWLPLRLSLVGPVVVAENTLGVERSWELTKGNALRMLGILVLAFVPYLIVSTMALTVALGSDFPAFPPFPTLTDGDAAKSAEAVRAASEVFAKAVQQWQIDFYKAMRIHWVEVNAVSFVGNVVATALWAGALGSAYAAVAGERGES